MYPEAMRQFKNWVLYSADKMPWQSDGKPAKANDPTTWSSYEEAARALERDAKRAAPKYQGLGFEFTPETEIVFIDVDHSIDEVGNLSKAAQYVYDTIGDASYVEVSKSGRGLHFFTRGTIAANMALQRDLENKAAGTVIEIYNAGRYCALTGNIYRGRDRIGEDARALQGVYNAFYVWDHDRRANHTPKKELEEHTPHKETPQYEDRAAEQIRTRWREAITLITTAAPKSDKGEATYICPLCGHGSRGAQGGNDKGLVYIPPGYKSGDFEVKDRATLHCFCCGFTGDIIKLWREDKKAKGQGDPGYYGALAAIADRLEIPIVRTPDYAAEEPAEGLQSAAYYLTDFLQEIEESKTEKTFSTGFNGLDYILFGGLRAGLYVVGAISSLGKTTLALQMADTIAAAGHDVLIFSLEMARQELIAKSVSRLTFKNSESNALTTLQVLAGKMHKNFTDEQAAGFTGAIKDYAQFAEHIFIIEGLGNVTAETIRKQAEAHTKATGSAPVIVIDYAQIIAPQDVRMTDKQAVDKNVLELKRLSRDLKTPVLAIASFNRDSYLKPVSMSAFKESGAIEYSSDVLIGLQYFGMDYTAHENENEHNKRVRELIKTNDRKAKDGEPQVIQLKVLKNRNGSRGETLLNFYTRYNCFYTYANDTIEAEEPPRPPKKKKRAQTREALDEAFFEVAKENVADLVQMADELDITKRQVKNLIEELGGYRVEGETVVEDF